MYCTDANLVGAEWVAASTALLHTVLLRSSTLLPYSFCLTSFLSRYCVALGRAGLGNLELRAFAALVQYRCTVGRLSQSWRSDYLLRTVSTKQALTYSDLYRMKKQ